jgi:hypothetical protein
MAARRYAPVVRLSKGDGPGGATKIGPQSQRPQADIASINPSQEAKMRKSIGLSTALIALLVGCSNPVVPAGAVSVTETISYTYAQILGAAIVIGAIYIVVDPLAPNWQIKETRLDENHFRIDMRMKRVTTGGVGESMDLFHRQADAIAIQTHSPGYTIMSFNEGLESTFAIARRWSRGVIELRPAPVKVGER